jgi:hypothetical protein
MLRSITVFRPLAVAPLFLAAGLTLGCGDDPPTAPTDPTTPVAVTETFTDSLNPNGARTFQFVAERAGSIIARLTSLTPDDTIAVGLSLGTWNGASCAIGIANENATVASTATAPVIGSASGTGAFCVRIYDNGKLTRSADFTITVEHF